MDPLTLSALIAGGSSIVSGGMSFLGNLFGSKKEASSAQAINAQNAALSREQMQWSERMSNTAHQREVADLRAAGLNPILSAGGGGAFTGSYSLPELRNPYSGYGDRMASAASVAADTAMKSAMVRGAGAEADMKQMERDYIRENSTSVFNAKYFGTLGKGISGFVGGLADKAKDLSSKGGTIIDILADRLRNNRAGKPAQVMHNGRLVYER